MYIVERRSFNSILYAVLTKKKNVLCRSVRLALLFGSSGSFSRRLLSPLLNYVYKYPSYCSGPVEENNFPRRTPRTLFTLLVSVLLTFTVVAVHSFTACLYTYYNYAYSSSRIARYKDGMHNYTSIRNILMYKYVSA